MTPTSRSRRAAPQTITSLKQEVVSEVDRLGNDLLAVSHAIHQRPELGFEEHFAHDLLASTLERAGFGVQRSAFGLETAFIARSGSRGPVVAVVCEYDALPGIGHACGHNVIAAAGLGAALSVAAVAEKAGGRVVVLGTPGEENGAGKHQMVEGGCLDGVCAALMVHPGPADLRSMDALALAAYRVEYFGRSAHAAARPERGRNALDAAVLGYMNVAALRQHIAGGERVHGVLPEAGEVETIIPDHTTAVYSVRSLTTRRLLALEERVVACLEAGAVAAGCTMEATRLSIYEPQFASHAGGTGGDRAVLDGAKALAMTLVDLWSDPAYLDSADRAHLGLAR